MKRTLLSIMEGVFFYVEDYQKPLYNYDIQEYIMKKIILIVLTLLSCSTFILSAQSRQIDYYSIGYNDAYNNKKFDSKYSIEKLADSLKKISDEDEKIQFIENAQAYNLGFTAGICDKQKIDYTDVYGLIYDYIKDYVSSSYAPMVSAEEYQGKSDVYSWYKSLGVIQVMTSDGATVRANVYLGYKKDDKATSTEITQRSVELKDFLRRYLRGKTKAELSNPNNQEKLKMEIRNGINDKVLSSSKVRDIQFEQLDVIE